jgi:hypothetical protein
MVKVNWTTTYNAHTYSKSERATIAGHVLRQIAEATDNE